MSKKQNILRYYERLLRKEGLYPEPFPEGCASLDDLNEQGALACVNLDVSGVLLRKIKRGVTSRQYRILKLCVEGRSLREIGRCLGVSEALVRLELQKIKERAIKPAPR